MLRLYARRNPSLNFEKMMKNAELLFVVGLVSDDSMRAYTLSKFRHPNFKWEVQFWPDIVTLKMFMHDV